MSCFLSHKVRISASLFLWFQFYFQLYCFKVYFLTLENFRQLLDFQVFYLVYYVTLVKLSSLFFCYFNFQLEGVQYWSQLLYFQQVKVVILAFLIHPSPFLSFAELEVDLIQEEAKPKSCLRVFVIYTNACGACLVEYVYFFLKLVEYHQ